MSDGLNRVFLLGHLGADPELRFSPSGMAKLQFNIATTSHIDVCVVVQIDSAVVPRSIKGEAFRREVYMSNLASPLRSDTDRSRLDARYWKNSRKNPKNQTKARPAT